MLGEFELLGYGADGSPVQHTECGDAREQGLKGAHVERDKGELGGEAAFGQPSDAPLDGSRHDAQQCADVLDALAVGKDRTHERGVGGGQIGGALGEPAGSIADGLDALHAAGRF